MKSISDPGSHAACAPDFPDSGSAGSISPAHPASRSQSTDWHDLVYELAPLAYLKFDSQGRLLDLNVAASRLLGASRQRDLHRPLTDFFSPRHHRRLIKHVRDSQKSKKPSVTRLNLRSGSDPDSVTEVEVTTSPASPSLTYRTHLVAISGGRPIVWPADDAKFRALVENSNEVICIGSPDGTIFYTTPSIRHVLGYDAADWFGRNAFEIMRPDHADLARAAMRELAQSPTGTVIRMVTQVRHLDGSWRWCEGVLTNLIAQPAVGGIVCNYRDITDARTSEEALRASEQRYRLLAESLPEMISIRDSDRNIEYFNSHWRDYLGVRATEELVQNWQDGVHPDDILGLLAPPWEDGIPKPWEAECRLRRASDGLYLWHAVRIVPILREGQVRWLAIATDIHERKLAAEERERLMDQLERERAQLAIQYAVVRVLTASSSLAEAAPPIISGFCEQLGWQAGALWAVETKGSSRVLSPLHLAQQPGVTPRGLFTRSKPAPLKKGESLAGRVWARKQPLAQSRLAPDRGAPHHRAAARLGLTHAFAFPITLAGEVNGVMEFFTRNPFERTQLLIDIVNAAGIQIGLFVQRTNTLDLLRQSEEALIQVNNALEQRVRERTAELHEANRELSSEIAERTRLEREIIRISEREQRRIGQDLHDGLCQELAAITFMARALSTRLGKSSRSGPDSSRTDAADRINHVAGLLNDTVSRCRDIARGLHPVEMDDDGLMVALSDLAKRTSQTIACSFVCNQPILVPESDMALNLYRIAQEAVNNAIRHARAKRVTITLDRKGADIRLSIRDDGRGIPSPSVRRKRSGMGLHIMRYRARAMTASLRIIDLHPHGTEVLCLLSA